MITIKNLRFDQPWSPYQIRVDRSSCLGNPYYMSEESKRNKVCDLYELWFAKVSKDLDSPQFAELQRLVLLYAKYERLELFCWCAPKRCHAETIKNYLLNNSFK